jgi:hypothetical protein
LFREGVLGEVLTHFDPHTRIAIIEYVTRPPADKKPAQKVTARRRKLTPKAEER